MRMFDKCLWASIALICSNASMAAGAQSTTPSEPVDTASTDTGAIMEKADAMTAEADAMAATAAAMTEEAEALRLAAHPELAKIWSGDMEAGYVSTSGNTEETSVKGRLDVNRETAEWRYNVHFDSLNNESDGERTAEKYFASNRLGYQFDERNYVFGYASYDEDHFSGFDFQATVSAGYGRRLLNTETMQWDLEVGPGYRFSKVDAEGTPEDGDESEEAILRVFSKYEWSFTETSKFSQELSSEAGDDNTISKSITALQVRVIGALALKLSYTVKYTEEVPSDKEHADTETAVTLLYSF